jgi:hypothetical protein
VCGSRDRILRVSGAAIARAVAGSGSLIVETWRDLYERHRGWLLAAGCVSVLSALVTRLLVSGRLAGFVGVGLLIVSWAFRTRGFKRKRVRIIEHHY